MIRARAVRRAIGIGVVVAAINYVYAQGQQPNSYSSPTIGATPLALTPGAPAGSFALSGFDNVNLFNGNLNFRLPLLHIGGRGSAGYTMTLKIEQKWRVETAAFLPPPTGGEPAPSVINHIPVGYWWAGLEPGYGPGVLQGRHSGDGSRTCAGFSTTQRFFDQTLTRLTFTAPDGTEYEFRDELTGGTPHFLALGEQCGTTTFSRGKVWITDGGAAATFISDVEIRDQYADPTVYPGDLIPANASGALFYPSGLLFMRDGTRYRIDNGIVSWIADRNGNQINFSGWVLPNLITDSLNREVTITYADFYASPPRMYDEIRYKGFDQAAHGADRSIKVYYGNLGSVLRSGSVQSTLQLFGSALDGSNTPFDPTVVSAVQLPDGRQYQFRYNAFGELARVVLPTGGAIEYDYDGGVGPVNNSGLLVSPNYEIYRRVVERRVYPNGGTGAAFDSRTSYSRPEGAIPNDAFVLVETRDSSNNVLAGDRHYFFGIASPTIFRAPNDYSFWSDGKEYKTRMYDAGGATLLRQMDQTWEQGTLASQQPGPANAPQNPRIKETLTTLSDTGQAARQSFGYDVYNNVTDACEYDYGSGSFGPLLRHTHTDYLKVHPASGVDYANSTFDLVQPKRNIHIRDLPLAQIVNTNCANTLNQTARTDYEYDNYGFDSNHAPLTPRFDISSYYSFFDANYTTRGNVTAVTRWLNSPSGSITSYQQYDIAGNVTKAIDPLGRATSLDYVDNFGNPDGSTDDRFSPPELNSGGFVKTYAFATSVTNALSHTAYTQYNYYAGKPVDAKDPNGVVMTGFYNDGLDRPTQIIHDNGVGFSAATHSQTTFSYNDFARTITTTSDKDGFGDNQLGGSAIYDGLGRTIETRKFEPGGYISTVQTYDGLGRAKRSSNPYRPQSEQAVYTRTDYDGIGRVKAIVTESDGAQVLTSYSGNTTTVTDQAGKSRQSITDAAGRLTRVIEDPFGLAYQTNYLYDALNNLTDVFQGSQHRVFVYDSLSRLRSASNPEQTGSTTYSYDANSNLFTKADPRGITTTFTYDALNRVKTRTYQNDLSGTPPVTYNYDDVNVPKSKGRLTSEVTSISSYSYSNYDAMGRVLGGTQTTNVNQTANSYSMSYTYDLAGNMRTETYPSGRVITTSYDGAGRINGIDGQKTGESTKTYASAFSYDHTARSDR